VATAPVLRRSALEAFACPWRYKAIHLDGVTDTSDEAIRGQAFHAAAHRYIAALWKTKQREDLHLAEEAFERGMLDVRTPAHLLPEVGDLFWQRWAPDFELDLDAYLSAEQRQVDALGYSWTPDLVYAHGDVLEVPDWKTYWIGFSAEQAQQEFQARFYAASARRLFPGFGTYRITFHFVRWGFSVSADFDAAALDQIDTEVDITRKNIEQAIAVDEFPAVPGQHCGYCRLRCPLVAEMRTELVQIVSREAAQQVAGEVLVLEQALRARKAALSAWCSGEGPVVVGGMEFSHRKTETTQFPIDKVLQVLEAQGITPTFRVSKSTLRTYLETKKYAHVRPALEPLAIVNVSTEFRARKAGAVSEEQE
jgi:hypothetical protein